MINGSSNSRYLLIVEDAQGRRTITLEDMKYSLGRKSDNQIVLRSKHASRYHATLIRKSIDRQKFSYWILDGDLEGNKSHNGIYVNGSKCLIHELKDGDLINFGCDINASFHLISNQEKIEPVAVKNPEQVQIKLRETETNYSQNNP
ncbi:MAG: FHA domain-containing protein, partial [Microcystis panniformis]